jgi:hypothetical protein
MAEFAKMMNELASVLRTMRERDGPRTSRFLGVVETRISYGKQQPYISVRFRYSDAFFDPDPEKVEILAPELKSSNPRDTGSFDLIQSLERRGILWGEDVEVYGDSRDAPQFLPRVRDFVALHLIGHYRITVGPFLEIGEDTNANRLQFHSFVIGHRFDPIYLLLGEEFAKLDKTLKDVIGDLLELRNSDPLGTTRFISVLETRLLCANDHGYISVWFKYSDAFEAFPVPKPPAIQREREESPRRKAQRDRRAEKNPDDSRDYD